MLLTVLGATVCTMDVCVKQTNILAKFLVKAVALHGAHRLIRAPVLWFKWMQAGHPSSSHVAAFDDSVSREDVSLLLLATSIIAKYNAAGFVHQCMIMMTNMHTHKRCWSCLVQFLCLKGQLEIWFMKV